MRATLHLCFALLLLLCATKVSSQTNWVKYWDNPVFDIGTPAGVWDDTRVSIGQIILEGGVYKAWYDGWDGTTSKNYQIGYATSTDGINWSRNPNPVLPQGNGTWDSLGVSTNAVIHDGSIYKMWYSGSNGTKRCIGYATSADGIGWTKYGSNPVLCPDSAKWDSWSVHWATVIKDGSDYKMWYSGGTSLSNHRIGYATSSDGISWNKYPGNPILGSQCGTWDSNQVWFPFVVKDGGTYHMWYAGNDGSRNRIGYATSLDGISWQVDCAPVLDVGSPGDWDDKNVNVPCVLQDEDGWKMWYQGNAITSSDTSRVGYAVSAPPVPALSNWALIILALLIAAISIIIIVQRRFGTKGVTFILATGLLIAGGAARAQVYVFQEGVNGYNGTLDTFIESDFDLAHGIDEYISIDCCDANVPSCLAGTMSVHTPYQGLLWFQGIFGDGPNQIPLGSTIASATLTLNVVQPTIDSGTCLHRMMQTWSESQSWSDWGDGIHADGIEAAIETDASLSYPIDLGLVVIDVTSSLQAWSDGAARFGWALLPSNLGEEGWRVSSSEEPIDPDNNHPRLEVVLGDPVPAASSWGLVIIALLGIVLGTVVLERRQRTRNA